MGRCQLEIKNIYKMSLAPFNNPDESVLEIGVDEVGRGPMFGRVYTAAVILPPKLVAPLKDT